MNFLSRVFVLSFVAAMLFTLPSPSAHAQEVDLRFEEYEELLNGLLRTRRDEEKAFVAVVLDRVQDGSIPERLVETSYKWVLNKRPNTNYPFVYFERVLRIQATQLELNQFIPEFDYEIYRTPIPRTP